MTLFLGLKVLAREDSMALIPYEPTKKLFQTSQNHVTRSELALHHYEVEHLKVIREFPWDILPSEMCLHILEQLPKKSLRFLRLVNNQYRDLIDHYLKPIDLTSMRFTRNNKRMKRNLNFFNQDIKPSQAVVKYNLRGNFTKLNFLKNVPTLNAISLDYSVSSVFEVDNLIEWVRNFSNISELSFDFMGSNILVIFPKQPEYSIIHKKFQASDTLLVIDAYHYQDIENIDKLSLLRQIPNGIKRLNLYLPHRITYELRQKVSNIMKSNNIKSIRIAAGEEEYLYPAL